MKHHLLITFFFSPLDDLVAPIFCPHKENQLSALNNHSDTNFFEQNTEVETDNRYFNFEVIKNG